MCLWVGVCATETPTPGPGGPWEDVLTLGSDRAGVLAVPGPGAAGASFGATPVPFLPRQHPSLQISAWEQLAVPWGLSLVRFGV